MGHTITIEPMRELHSGNIYSGLTDLNAIFNIPEVPQEKVVPENILMDFSDEDRYGNQWMERATIFSGSTDLSYLLDSLKQNSEKSGLLHFTTVDTSTENVLIDFHDEDRYGDKWKSTGWDGVGFPMVRRVFSSLAANELVSVQPLSAPSGLLFYMDHTYGNNNKNKKRNVLFNLYQFFKSTYEYVVNRFRGYR